jgi:hypothetical protein
VAAQNQDQMREDKSIGLHWWLVHIFELAPHKKAAPPQRLEA